MGFLDGFLVALLEVRDLAGEEERPDLRDGMTIDGEVRSKVQLPVDAALQPPLEVHLRSKERRGAVVDVEVRGDGGGAEHDEKQPEGVFKDGRDRAAMDDPGRAFVAVIEGDVAADAVAVDAQAESRPTGVL